MLRTFLLLLLSVEPSASVLVAQDSATARVLAADNQRFAAMMRADTAALRTRLADDLAYTHTTGTRQNKAEFLCTLASGQLRYRSIAPSERTVRFLGAEGAVVGAARRCGLSPAARYLSSRSGTWPFIERSRASGSLW